MKNKKYSDRLEYVRNLAYAIKEIETMTGKRVETIDFTPVDTDDQVRPTRICFVGDAPSLNIGA